MIVSSRLAKFAAVALAAGTHLAVSAAVAPDDPHVEIESAAGAAEARLGNSFADMSAGTLTPAEVDKITEATQPEPLNTPTPPLKTLTPKPKTTPSADPTALAVLQSKPVETQAAKPVQKVIEAAPDDPTAASPRPQRRNPDLAPRKPVQVATSVPQKKAPKATRESGQVTKRRGSTTGIETARATSQGTSKGRAKESGNAATSNYSGEVMRRISRVRKPNVNTRGVAVVSFAIASNGGLSNLSIARSSGSATLDKAALGVIRKAQPFPAPPHGARRTFSIKIKGR